MFSSEDNASPFVSGDVSSDSPNEGILRNPQLMKYAYSSARRSANKDSGSSDSSSDDMFAIVSFNGYEANGVTTRILDDYGLTQRILDDYGVTRRVLEDYGITQRVLDDYGVTQRVLDDYGLTKRVLDDYGITQRILDDFGLTNEAFEELLATYPPAITLRSRMNGGISVRIKHQYLEAILGEMADNCYIKFLEPDAAMDFIGPGNSRNRQEKKLKQLDPWGVKKVSGGSFDADVTENTHVFVLDSGISGSDINVVSNKDFTSLFVNRDQDQHEENDWSNPGFFDPGTTGNPADENGHGTHVAGTLAAIDNDFGILGAVAGLKLHNIKVLTAEGQTDVTTLVAALNYVVYQKEHVFGPDAKVLVNLSIGMDTGSTDFNVFDDVVQQVVDAGIVVVVSAGNASKDVSTVSPAHVPGVITVGSYGKSKKFSDFSNTGSGIDILAPGENIQSLSNYEAEVQNNIYVERSGTSMAAPHVTAAAALYWSMNPSASASDVEAGLLEAAEKVVKKSASGTTGLGVSMDFGKSAQSGKSKKDKKSKK